MNKTEAQAHLNKPVTVWTSTHGLYTGTLRRVICAPKRPWRGKVEIDELLDAQGARSSRWYSPGDVVEAGSASIRVA